MYMEQVCYSSHELNNRLYIGYSDHGVQNKAFDDQTQVCDLNTSLGCNLELYASCFTRSSHPCFYFVQFYHFRYPGGTGAQGWNVVFFSSP